MKRIINIFCVRFVFVPNKSLFYSILIGTRKWHATESISTRTLRVSPIDLYDILTSSIY